MKPAWQKYLIILIVILGLGVYLFHKVDLTTADLGRHIKNGQMIFEGHFKEIVSHNYYSYSYPESTFINHHWLTGIIFFLIEKGFGFGGLTILYGALLIGSLLLSLKIQPKLHPLVLIIVLALVIPLIGNRFEIRPEGFSYLLFSIVWLIVHNFSIGRWSKKVLWWLPLIMLVWVNLHIYFIFGLGLIIAYFVWSLITKRDYTPIILPGLVSVGACCLNPSGLTGLIYPLNIFRTYGYNVLENMSASYLIERGLTNPVYWWIVVVLVILVVTSIWQYMINRQWRDLIIQILAIIMGLVAFNAIRNTALFGITATVALGINFQRLIKIYLDNPRRILAITGAVIWLVVIVIFNPLVSARAEALGWGLGEGVGCQKAAQFIKANNISGPMFNDYDIGGCLIYELFPDIKPYVDNRPEAYPEGYFQEEYIPMQSDPALWSEYAKKYQFNVLVIYRADLAEWTQTLLGRVEGDNQWVRVYTDERIVVYVANDTKNQTVIDKYGQ